ncbi:hypothetical protein CVS40_5146 [Lucilia cuprina]|nr:hypothetical protein CVS40_5146 [Lucilia cuprina]
MPYSLPRAPIFKKLPQNQTQQVTLEIQVYTNQLDENRLVGEPQPRPSSPNSPQSSHSSPRSAENQRQYIRNLVTAAVGAQQAEMLSSLSEQLTQLIQSNIEAGFHRMTISNNNATSIQLNEQNNIPNGANNYTQNNHGQGMESQTLNQLLGLPQTNNQENFINFNANPSANLFRANSGLSTDLSVRPDKISQIISNWRLKFSGNCSSLSVDSFLYRVEALTNQTLGGNFDLLCKNASALFEGKASDWYWRYHKTVREIKWTDLCLALRRQFRDTRTDMDYRELIRDRKQKPGESFDTFYDSILELVDHLDQPIAESLMIEILRRNILPEIQHEILNLQIFSVDHLRDICRKREFFLQDIRKRNVAHRPLVFSKKIAELYEDSETASNIAFDSDNDVSELSLICWNCRKIGHRYQDCLAERNVFCYGCGAPNNYKPTCSKCNPAKNLQSSAHPSARKPLQLKKTDRSTSTD